MKTPEEGSLILTVSILERLKIAGLFPKEQPVELELGSGDGSFLVQYAGLHPEHNFIGLERLLGRLRKIDRKGRRAGLQNLKAVRLEASYFLQYVLPKDSISAIHVYFPDPWPKRKHRKNRLIQTGFPELCADVLKKDGRVYLRTDDVDYFNQMQEVFGASPLFRQIETPESLSSVLTDFERGFLIRGVQTNRAAFELIRR
ncbi:MAG: tRNA (guanosine(46)-N7)-methyltransferase TrmB [Limisphaerales bacterium]